MEFSDVVWMEEIFKIVGFTYYIVCFLSASSVLLFKGQSGDVFTGLSAGSHTINVQFTPAGLSQILRLTLRFTVGNYYCMYFIDTM